MRDISEYAKRLGLDPAQFEARSRSLSSTGTVNDVNNPLMRGIEVIKFSGRQEPVPREWIVDNHLFCGHAASWYGEGGVAKSLIGMHLGLTLASAKFESWHGFKVKTVPVLYMDFELDADEQHRRALQLAAGMGLDEIPPTFWYLQAAMLKPAVAFAKACEVCEEHKIGLVIVDSVGFALDGDSETSRDVLGFFRDYIQPLKDADASPLLIDHQAKVIKGEKYSDKQAFGSVYKTNSVRTSFQIRGHAGAPGELTATFTQKKNNLGFREPDFSLRIIFDNEKITVDRLSVAAPNPDHEPSKKERVLAAYIERGRSTPEEIADATEIALPTVRNATSELMREEELVDTGEKKGRSRIVVHHSRTTKGTGTGTTAQAVTSEPETELEKVDGIIQHPADCACEWCRDA